MSVRHEKNIAPIASPAEQMATAISDAQPGDANLQEGATFQTSSAENPLLRNVVVSIRASLNDLCLKKDKGSWSPSGEALRNILQQKKVWKTPRSNSHSHCMSHYNSLLIFATSLVCSSPPWMARRTAKAT